MPTLTRTLTCPAPPPRVRAYLRDFTHAERSDPGTKVCKPLTDEPIGIGSQWRNISEFRGRETTLTYTLEIDEPGHLRLVGRNRTVTSATWLPSCASVRCSRSRGAPLDD